MHFFMSLLMDAFCHVKDDHPICYVCEVYCSVLQRIAVYYSALQCALFVAVCCNAFVWVLIYTCILMGCEVYCSVLQRNAA